jgi:hypothetical protein
MLLRGAGQVKLICTGGMELPDSITEDEFNDWYNKEVKMLSGYMK